MSELSRTKEHSAWRNMRQRCSNPNCHLYPRYGAKGIKVSKRWAIFSNFLKDMGMAPSPKHSIDRIDGRKGYTKSNCRWATSTEQNLNSSQNVRLTFNGKTLCLSQWSRQTGIHHATLSGRIKAGWDVGRILSAKPRAKTMES